MVGLLRPAAGNEFAGGSAASYTYTGAGKEDRVTGSLGTTYFAYDGRSHLIQETRRDGGVVAYT